MATIKMRAIHEGEIPFAAGTAVQDDPTRPAFNGTGPNDYVCSNCGNVLAHDMHPLQMNKKVRVKCAVCETINVAVDPDDAESASSASA
jgi:DNA-directed RNA polymerase subunit RPC12/RpoP